MGKKRSNPVNPPADNSQQKRPKTATPNKTNGTPSTSRVVKTSSRIFSPFRALGYVTGEVVPTFQMRQFNASYITTAALKTFHIYDCAHFNLLFVGGPTEEPIIAMTCYDDFTAVSAGKKMILYERAKQILSLDVDSPVFQLLVFGGHLLGLHESNKLSIWDRESFELYSSIEFAEHFHVSCMLHPSTYVNKLLVGSREGLLQLWNVKSGTIIFEFDLGINEPVTCLQQSTALDVVAVGTLGGQIVLHNILYNERLFKFRQEGQVLSMSFRRDGVPILASASNNGDIALWNLDQRKLVHIMKNAHDDAVNFVEFYPSQPILLTSGVDNAIKSWVFDTLDGNERLVRSREGHRAPPRMIRYYGASLDQMHSEQQPHMFQTPGYHILSGGLDGAFRDFSTVRDSQSFEMSQGSLLKRSKQLGVSVDKLKLPPIIAFASAETRARDWDNIVTCHMNDTHVYTWRYLKKAIGQHILSSRDKSNPMAVTISVCGNFALIGYASGRIDTFNIQSGLHRRNYMGHTKAITGIASDNLNKHIISSSLDGTIKMWFMTEVKNKPFHEFVSGDYSPVTHLQYHRDSDLLATASDDLVLRVYDADTRTLVREFRGHRSKITDIAFSPDARWIVSTSADASIRVWDIPAAALVDVFRVDSVPTSVCFSPNSDFLATTHVNNIGIYLWLNKTLYSNVSLRGIRETSINLSSTVSLPIATGELEDEGAVETDPNSGESDYALADPEKAIAHRPAEESMISLSGVPQASWHNLVNLETIRKRNKPIKAARAPAKAPFFLPTQTGLNPRFNIPDATEKQEDDQPSSRIISLGAFNLESSFVQELRACHMRQDYTMLWSTLKSMGPSAIDLEIRSLSLEKDCLQISLFMDFLIDGFSGSTNFELLQSYLNVFLTVHGETLEQQTNLKQKLERLRQLQQHSWTRVQNKLQHSLSLLDFCRKAGF